MNERGEPMAHSNGGLFLVLATMAKPKPKAKPSKRKKTSGKKKRGLFS